MFFDRRRKPFGGFSRQFDYESVEVVPGRSSYISTRTSSTHKPQATRYKQKAEDYKPPPKLGLEAGAAA
jgi:hypothetical protein